MIAVEWGAATDVGRVRRVNEDALLTEPPVFLVADGMGGYAAGDVASAIVVDEFRLAEAAGNVGPDWVLDRFRAADQRIRECGGGGTTVAGILAVEEGDDSYWLVFNLGDSRVYHRTEGVLSQISVDHSVVQELVDAGALTAERARLHPQRHVITRAVGAEDEPAPDFWLLPARVGDRLMLCSDGLCGEVEADAIRAVVLDGDQPQQVADDLLELAMSAGGRDNVTVIVVDVTAVANEQPRAETTIRRADLVSPVQPQREA